jgi:hypothetical protein
VGQLVGLTSSAGDDARCLNGLLPFLRSLYRSRWAAHSMHLVEAGFGATEDLWRIDWFSWVLFQERAAVRSTRSIFILIYRTQEFNRVAGLVRCSHAISLISGVWIEATICRYTNICFINLIAFHIRLGLPSVQRLSFLWRSILILSIFIFDVWILLNSFLVCEFHDRALEWRCVVRELLVVCMLLLTWGSQ